MNLGTRARTTAAWTTLCLLFLPLLISAASAAGDKAEPVQGGSRSKQLQLNRILQVWKSGGGEPGDLEARIRRDYGTDSPEGLSEEQCSELLRRLGDEMQTKVVVSSLTIPVYRARTPLTSRSQLYHGSDFYRRTMPGFIELIAAGKTAEAIAGLQKLLAENPGHAEIHYGLAMAHGAARNMDLALKHMGEALEAGLPAGRFLAGPTEALRNLGSTTGYRELLKGKEASLVHGPAINAVTDRSVRIWVRTAKASKVGLRLRPAHSDQADEKLIEAMSSEKSDFTAVLEADGLAADTPYLYSLSLDGAPLAMDPAPGFRAAPKSGEPGIFRIGIGSKSGYAPAFEGIWQGIGKHPLNAFFLLGDGLSVRRPGITPAAQRYAVYRRQSSPPFRRFAASTPVYATWDDNDFGVRMGRKPDDLSASLGVFRQDHAHRPGPDDGRPGIWYQRSIGDVSVFVLDCVTQRSAPGADAAPGEGAVPGGDEATLLGEAQRKWLLDGLMNSEATFNLIASSVPWSPGAAWWKDENSWDRYRAEREQIFSFIEENEIEGVVLLSGGAINATELRRIPRKEGYDLYELHSSRLASPVQVLTPGGALLNHDESGSFGLLEIDTTREDPRIIFRTVDAAGEAVRHHDFNLYHHNLDFEGLPEWDGIDVDLTVARRPLVYDDGEPAEPGKVTIRIENTSDEAQGGVLHLHALPASSLRFTETPEYYLDPGQVIERALSFEMLDARSKDLVRIYSRESREAFTVGRKVRAPKGKSSGDDSLDAIMELVDFRFNQTPGYPLLESEGYSGEEMGRIWFAMIDDMLIIRCKACDAAPSRKSGRWTWNLWEGSSLEVFGVNRGEQGRQGENIAQIFLVPGVRAIPGTSLLGRPMAYRLWRDYYRTNYASGYEGEPLPEIKVRSSFTSYGWIIEAMIPFNLPVTKPEVRGVPGSVSGKKKMVQLYPDQLRVEFKLNTTTHPNHNHTYHGTMQKRMRAAHGSENYVYVEWLDVDSWDEKEEEKRE